MIRVLVVSPYPTVRAGLRALLQHDEAIEVAWEAQGAPDLGGPWPARPDVALMDEASGSGVMEALEARAPELGVVVLGAEQADYRAGSSAAPRGFLTHDATAEELAAAIRAVAHGLTVVDPALAPALLAARPRSESDHHIVDETLTPRELEVLHLLAAGLPNKTIAIRLRISEHTAKFHVSSVLSKLGAASRTEAVTTAARRGLLLL